MEFTTLLALISSIIAVPSAYIRGSDQLQVDIDVTRQGEALAILDISAPEALVEYKRRDEQEKSFQQMKTQMVCNRQRNWSEEGKTGRLFILFVSMVLGSYFRHVWKSSKPLRDEFQSSKDMLDEMRAIRCLEHKGKATMVTPFVGAQLKIAAAFK